MVSRRFEELLEKLKTGPLLWDGGMGTQLQDRGLPPGDSPEQFNESHPEVVAAIHREYFDAGADGVETNTFGANRIGLSRYDLDGKAAHLNRLAAQIARSACPRGKWVAGSIGPTGQFPEPYGTCSLAEMYDAFAEQAVALREGGADFFLVETMVDLREAAEAVKACLGEGGLPVILSVTFNQVPAGFRTLTGASPRDACQALLKLGVSALGTNCSNSMDAMVEVTRELRAESRHVPLSVMPNAGLPEMIEKKAVYPHTPEKMAGKLQALLEAGAGIVGGCCGTTPEHTRAFRAKLDSLPRPEKQATT
jgi:5-methyltetrahydrofolate--homocysteine methyltransferase